MTIAEYAKKHNRDPDDNLATFAVEYSFTGQFRPLDFVRENPGEFPFLYRRYGITDDREWGDALGAAIESAKLCQL